MFFRVLSLELVFGQCTFLQFNRKNVGTIII